MRNIYAIREARIGYHVIRNTCSLTYLHRIVHRPYNKVVTTVAKRSRGEGFPSDFLYINQCEAFSQRKLLFLLLEFWRHASISIARCNGATKEHISPNFEYGIRGSDVVCTTFSTHRRRVGSRDCFTHHFNVYHCIKFQSLKGFGAKCIMRA